MPGCHDQTLSQRPGGQAHLAHQPNHQRPPQQGFLFRAFLVDRQQFLPMTGRGGNTKRPQRVPVSIVGIGGQEGVFLADVAPPAKRRVRAGHSRQPQAVVAELLTQPTQSPIRQPGSFQRRINQRQRDQPAGGLLHATEGIIHQGIGDPQKQVGRVTGQTQPEVGRVCRNFDLIDGLIKGDRQSAGIRPAAGYDRYPLLHLIYWLIGQGQASINQSAPTGRLERDLHIVGSRLQRQ